MLSFKAILLSTLNDYLGNALISVMKIFNALFVYIVNNTIKCASSLIPENS